MTYGEIDAESPEGSASRRAILRGLGLAGVAAALTAAGWRTDTIAQDSTPVGGAIGEPNAVVILFGTPADVAAFEDYYVTTHWPLALQMPGMLEILGGPTVGMPGGGESEYHRMAILRFASQADLQRSIASPKGREVLGDVTNFATGGVTVFLTPLESAAGVGAVATPGS